MTEHFLLQRLSQRKELGLFRSLKITTGLIDFCSNDYLGFANSGELLSLVEHFPTPSQHTVLGSKGSRLLAGNTAFAEQLEQYIAGFHIADTGLLFNSGYDANVGLFSSVPGKNDTVIFDELIHASVHDGMRLGRATTMPFVHNNIVDLEMQLRVARESKGNDSGIFVAVESIYSMDGDQAPLTAIAALCERFNAALIVDEAHATGLVGSEGKGLVNELHLEEKVFARLHTFGKALGCHGAIVLGSETLRSYLINFARPFIYSTALPFPALVAIRCAYDLLPNATQQRRMLQSLIQYFKTKMQSLPAIQLMTADGPIQSVIIPGNQKVRAIAAALEQEALDVRPIVSPTVPKGSERLRICLHAFNTEAEVDRLISGLRNEM